MDEQDTQDLQSQSNLKFGSITEAIIGCAFEVINELGLGFLESVYEKALAIALQEKGLTIQCQHPIQVRFRNQIVGDSWTLSCSSCPSMFIRKRGDLRFVPIAVHRYFHLLDVGLGLALLVGQLRQLFIHVFEPRWC
ncbi:GxxExxY protein [Pirellulaceae bacterium SH467]